MLVLNKESVSPIETARGVRNFGLSTIHIKIYRGDSNAAGSSAGNPAEQVLAEELEAPGGPEDRYSTDSPAVEQCLLHFCFACPKVEPT